MNKTLLFFYGLIISGIATTGVTVYMVALAKEAKAAKINHSNFGSD